MNTTEAIKQMPSKIQRRVASGELAITRVDKVQCITIPLSEYMGLLDDRTALKMRKKK